MWWIWLIVVVVFLASHWFHHRYNKKEEVLKLHLQREDHLGDIRKERNAAEMEKVAFQDDMASLRKKHAEELNKLNHKYELVLEREDSAKAKVRELRGEVNNLNGQLKQAKSRGKK